MKKGKGGTVPRHDDKLPTKAGALPLGKRASLRTSSVEVPSYDKPKKKTNKKPSRGLRQTGPAKAVFKPGAGRHPAVASRDVTQEDQIARPSRRSAAATREQYVRLRIRVHNDRLSVLDSHLVDGPLSQANTFAGPNAYEVTVGDRLLHADALPDLGVQRSFVNPSGPPEQRGHHITERPIYEFTARVPAHELSRKTLSGIRVRLYRLKDQARTDSLSSAPLAQQFERQMRRVAELTGLPASVLPAAIEKRGGRTPSA
jgi:hypothetical protein